MNTAFKIPTAKFCAAVCFALMATCSPATARPPQAIVQRGTIEAIDRDAHILRLQRHGEAVSLMLAWNSRTHVFEGTRAVTADELTRGASVTVWYRNPLFGERFATKILIEIGLVRPVQRGLPRNTSAKP